MKKFIILTIAKSGNKSKQFGLQLQNEDLIIAKSCLALVVKIEEISIPIRDGLFAFINNGRISNPEIHRWVKKNKLNVYPVGKPFKMIFSVSIRNKNTVLTLYPFQYGKRSNFLK